MSFSRGTVEILFESRKNERHVFNVDAHYRSQLAKVAPLKSRVVTVRSSDFSCKCTYVKREAKKGSENVVVYLLDSLEVDYNHPCLLEIQGKKAITHWSNLAPPRARWRVF